MQKKNLDSFYDIYYENKCKREKSVTPQVNDNLLKN